MRNLTCYDQLLVICLAQYADKNSLRDIEASLNALAVAHKFYHCGIGYAVPCNTLAKANELRDWHIYAELGQVLIKKVRPLYAKDSFRIDIDNMVYAFDSSTISLCLRLCPWARFKKEKGGIKLQTQLDLMGNLPVFILLTKASVHDVNALDEICVEMGAIYLIDKGYVDFSRHEIVRFTKENSKQKYPKEFRMVVYEDFATGNVYRFITNYLGYEALTIAELYRKRWNVELFFKWINNICISSRFMGPQRMRSIPRSG